MRRRRPTPTETATEAPASTETPYPSPVETTIETPAPSSTATAAPDRDGHGDRRRREEAHQEARRQPLEGEERSGPRVHREGHGQGFDLNLSFRVCQGRGAGACRPGRECADSHKRRRQPRDVEPELLARGPGPREDRRAELLHRQVPDSPVPAPDLPGRRHAVRRPLGDPRGHQRDRDRLRPQPERLLRRRAGLDAVHARHVEGLRRRRQPRRRQGPVQPGRRDLRRRALPEGRGRRHRHPQGRLRLQPRRLVRGLRPDARPGHRRHPRRPRRLAHRPHAGPLPGPRQGDLRRRAQEGRPHDQGRQQGRRRRVRRDPPQHRDLRQGRLARDRRQRRQGPQARRQQAPRPLRDRAGRLRQHLHVRAPEDGRQDLPGPEEAHPLREGRRPPSAVACEHESKADAKAADAQPAETKTEDDRAAAAAPVAKVRLFANPTRKNARKAGGDVQVAGGETATAGAPLGLDPDDFVAKPLVKGARVLGGTTLGRIGKTSNDEGPAPAVRDPPGRPRRPAHRPEADPRRLEAARVHRGLPRQGQERAVRLRRRRAHDRPDHAHEQGDARPPRARRPPDQDLRLRPRRRPRRRHRPPRARDARLPRLRGPEADGLLAQVRPRLHDRVRQRVRALAPAPPSTSPRSTASTSTATRARARSPT